MGQKVGAAVPLSVGAQQLPTFRPMSIVYVYVSFWTDHSHIKTRVDENNLFELKPTLHAGCPPMSYPYNGILHQTGFQLLRYITTRFY